MFFQLLTELAYIVYAEFGCNVSHKMDDETDKPRFAMIHWHHIQCMAFFYLSRPTNYNDIYCQVIHAW